MPKELTPNDLDALIEMVPQWQPIETAPKDGTWILLYHAFKGVMSGKGHIFTGCYREIFDEKKTAVIEGWWQVDTRMAPTHWMPLPQPPKGDRA